MKTCMICKTLANLIPFCKEADLWICRSCYLTSNKKVLQPYLNQAIIAKMNKMDGKNRNGSHLLTESISSNVY